MTSQKQIQYRTIQIPAQTFHDVINGYGHDGWDVVFMKEVPNVDGWGKTWAIDMVVFMKREEIVVQSKGFGLFTNIRRMFKKPGK